MAAQRKMRANGLETAGATDPFRLRLAQARRSLSPAAQRVARFIEANRALALASSAADLAAHTGTSDATVVRTVQALGFDRLSDLRQTLAASLDHRATPADNMRRTLAEIGTDAERAIDLVIDVHKEGIEALQCAPARAQIAKAVSTLHPATRIFVFGIGPSAQLARYMSMLLNRNGRHAAALDATGIALADQLLELRDGDAVLLLAYGVSYREVVTTLSEAKRLGLPSVLVTDTLESDLARQASVVVPARRGRAERVALHGATLVVLEAILLGLAVADKDKAVTTLDRLNDLRSAVAGKRSDVG